MIGVQDLLDRHGVEPDCYFALRDNGRRGQFLPKRLGDRIEAEGHVVVGEDGRLHRYTAGVYRPDGEEWARAQIRQRLGDEFRDARASDTIAYLKARERLSLDPRDLTTINLANGLLDWRTGRLRPHDPEYRTRVQLPVPWRPDATCPAIDAFLADVLEPEVVPLVEEMIGLLLIPETRYRQAFLLRGPGGNGKSTLLAVIEHLLGHANVSSVSLQAIDDNRFAAAELHGRLANICGDLDPHAARSSSAFKQIVGGVDRITAERKFQAPFEYAPVVRLLFSANEAPQTTDYSEAYFDRWMPIPMQRRFAPEERIKAYIDRLVTPQELAGLLVRAVAGLRRLEARGRFDPPGPVVEAVQQYRVDVDPVAAFIDEACLVAPGAWATRVALYDAYRAWSEANGRHALSARRFTAAVRQHVGGVDEKKVKGARQWDGIGLLATQ